ncbi:hypothetical protein CDIK_3824 [Cucumispora dikerogammari]|nr:hypothetical protein CDIK_3824 [Cucumispora dikerogammari]
MKRSLRKGNVGRVPETIWRVGGICRVHKKFFYEHVKKRSADILHDILKIHVRLESTKITDEWKGYSGIDKGFSRHLKTNHSKYFVDSVNPLTHTQGIESLWGRLKRCIKKQGTDQKTTLRSLVLEFKFKRLEKDVFQKISTIFLS